MFIGYLIMTYLGLIAILVFGILSVVQFIKRNNKKGVRHLMIAGISVLVVIFSFVASLFTVSEYTSEDKVEVSADVQKVDKEPEETPEEKATHGTNEAEEKAFAEQKVEEKVEPEGNSTWTESIEKIISNGGTETEKADAVEMLARDYAPTEEELTVFSDEIINEFKSKEYIINLNNELYTLSNLFKSIVVERNAGEPMKSFAFDFYQNTKYNYRGVENMLSESTISNEEQMKKALSKMGK